MLCGKYFYGEKPVANVLLFDIETLPMWMRAWRLGDQNWDPDDIIYDWLLLSFSAKWLFRPEHEGMILNKEEVLGRDDRRLVTDLHRLLSKADVVIAHNGQAFDVGRVNAKFLEYDLAPPAPYKTIDTLIAARKVFGDGLSSKKLDWIAQKLGVGRKIKTDKELWKRCESGEQEALDYMYDYNCKDVYILEDVYVKLRPWIPTHPNMSLFIDADEFEHRCTRCGSEDLEQAGTYRTEASVFDSYQCSHCGAWTRHSKKNKSIQSVSRGI